MTTLYAMVKKSPTVNIDERVPVASALGYEPSWRQCHYQQFDTLNGVYIDAGYSVDLPQADFNKAVAAINVYNQAIS